MTPVKLIGSLKTKDMRAERGLVEKMRRAVGAGHGDEYDQNALYVCMNMT